MKGVYLFLGTGFEEIEALAVVDILRRGGVDVKTVSIHYDKVVSGAHKIPVAADMPFGEFKSEVRLDGADSGDVMIFPGGMPGTRNLASCAELMNLMRLHYAEGGSVAAICAAPGLIVSQLGDLGGKHFTCYDGFEDALISLGGVYEKKPAVTDGNLITGRGPGCALEFGIAVLAHIRGAEAADEVREAMLF